MVPITRALANDIESMFDELRDHAEQRIGKASIAALRSLSADWLPKILTDFRRLYLFRKIGVNMAKDLRGVGLIAAFPIVLSIPNNSPFRYLKQVISIGADRKPTHL